MSLNRRKNIYTLGDCNQQHQQIKFPTRRQKLDPFASDPFKIQSYNFRYADRPSFPLPAFTSRVSTQTANKRFETFYYNYDFAPACHDKENSPTNKFHEFRRRKFLHDYQQVAPTEYPSGTSGPNSPQTQCERQQRLSKSNLFRTSSNSPLVANNNNITNSIITNASSSNAQSLLQTGTSRTLLSGARSPSTDAPTTIQSARRQNLQRESYACSLDRSNVGASTERAAANRSQTSLAGFNSINPFRQHNEIFSSGKIADKSISMRPSSLHHNLRSRQAPGENAAKATAAATAASAYVLTGNDQQTMNARSGCSININIKGIDDMSRSENVIIKIKSDCPNGIQCRKSSKCFDEYHLVSRSHSQQRQSQNEKKQTLLQQFNSEKYESQTKLEPQQEREHHHYHSSQSQSQHHQVREQQQQIRPKSSSEGYFSNAGPKKSSESLNLDKPVSKTSMHRKIISYESLKDREANHHSDPKMTRDHSKSTATSSRHFVVPNRSSFERLPSLIPLNTPKGLQDCFTDPKSQPSATAHVVDLSKARHLNQMRRIDTVCRAHALTNADNPRKKPLTSPGGIRSATTTTTTTTTTKSVPMRGEHKLFSTMMANRNIESIMPQSKTHSLHKKHSVCCENRRENISSRHSLHAVKESYSRDIFKTNRFSETDFAAAGHHHPSIQQCRHKLSPLNVNINVFTDRMKLLRV